MVFIIEWVLKAALILTVLTIDNLLWINKSGEWWSKAKVKNWVGEWEGPVKDYDFYGKLEYFISYRILTVWSNWRDILSAIIGGFILAIVS